MTFCSHCGKKLTEIKDFCQYCGKELKQKNDKKSKAKDESKNEKAVKHHITLSIFLIVIFTSLIILTVIFLKQRGSVKIEEHLLLTLPEEGIIDISEQIKEIKTFEEKRKEGYKLNEKPFDEGNYEYDERTADFRLVCEKPCPVSRMILDQEFAAISYGVSTMRGLTQSDINQELLPFEVHASEDSVCKTGIGAAYATSFTDKNGYSRGLLCFFYDKISYNRDKFPYSTSVHEVVHLFQQNRLPPYEGSVRAIWEGMAEMMESFFVRGNERNSFCWGGNDWYGQIVNNPDDPHGTGRQLFFILCNQYGFDYDDLPELFRQLDNRDVSIIEFINIINNITERDTSNLFQQAGVT